MTRRKAIGLLFSTVGACGVARADDGDAPKIFERALMGTRFEIKAFHPDRELVAKAAEAAFATAFAINDVASDYIADSELLSLSKHPAGNPVVVSPLLFGLLEQAMKYAEATDGCFDPTLGPVTKLWRETRRRKKLPDPEVLRAALESCGWRNLQLDERKRTVTLHKPGMRLDLGGIGKGQAADAMLREMVRYGVSRTCITCGGDIRVGDSPPGEDAWKVGVRTFDATSDSRMLMLRDGAVSTSGDLQQAVEVDGVRYAHLIDPATGLGLTRPVSATVVSPFGALSDALATACCVARPDQAREIAKALGATLYLP